MKDVLLFATVGPNPAPVSEAIWALYKQRESRVVEAHLVTLARGHFYLHAELLGPSGALRDLGRRLPGILAEDAVHEVRVRNDDREVETDLDPDDSAAYRTTIWKSARKVLDRASERPVVFLLAGGRQRTMTAYAVMTFQLLARDQDYLMDVRVSNPIVEGGTGFFFPEQTHRHLQIRGQTVDATSIEVKLVDVAVPRVRTLLPKNAFRTYDDALVAWEMVVQKLTPPRLDVDLTKGRVSVADEVIPLPMASVLWVAALALQRGHDPHDGWLDSADTGRVRTLLRPLGEPDWLDLMRSERLRQVLGFRTHRRLGACDKDAEMLAKLRADTAARLRRWVEEEPRRRPWANWLVPEQRKRAGGTAQRLALPASSIRVVFQRASPDR